MQAKRIFAALATVVLVLSAYVPAAAASKQNVMADAAYVGDFNLNTNSFKKAEDGSLSDPTKLIDGKYGRADFKTKSGEKIMLKVALSYKSMDGALMNMEAELPGWNFEKVRKDAEEAWNNELSRIEIETADEETLKIFYTALYHSMIFPSTYSDCTEKDSYTNFSLWDTYRAWSPLFTIIRSDIYPDFMDSFIEMYEKSGRIPVWPMVGVETDCMIAETRGIFMERVGSSPRLNLTSGVLRETLAGMQFASE